MTYVYPRERFSSEVTLTPAMVGEFAKAAGDDNPLHHDAAFAASTRYGRPIASGTHTTALLLGLTAVALLQARRDRRAGVLGRISAAGVCG
jgi:acyl dehydratase